MKTRPTMCLSLWCGYRTLLDECRGQDLIEYALMAGLVATGIVTMSPQVAAGFITIMSRVNSVVVVAGSS